MTDNSVGHLFVASASGIPRFVIGQTSVLTGSGLTTDHIQNMSDNDLTVVGTFYAGSNYTGIRISDSSISVAASPGYIGVDETDLTLTAGGFGIIQMNSAVGIGTTLVPRNLWVSGDATVNGTVSGLTGLTLTSGAITLGGSTGSGLCITGGASASWGSCGGGTNYWQQALVVLGSYRDDSVVGDE